MSTPLELVFELGGSFPIDTAAVGRSILAYLDHDEVAARVGVERAAALRPTLHEIREAHGVALSKGEASPYMQSLAAVIRSRSGALVAAIGVGGANLGEELDYESSLAAQLRRSTTVIGQQLP